MKIALMGYARSGKDEICSILRGYFKETNRGDVVQLAFGNALRKYAHELTDVPTEPKPRWLYEQFGKAMRDIDPDVWVKQVDKNYQSALRNGFEHFVITDLRQPNEYQWAKDNGFIIVYVDAKEEIRKERSKGDSNWVAVNPSETEIANLEWKISIVNNGKKESLEKCVEAVVKTVEGGLFKCIKES